MLKLAAAAALSVVARVDRLFGSPGLAAVIVVLESVWPCLPRARETFTQLGAAVDLSEK